MEISFLKIYLFENTYDCLVKETPVSTLQHFVCCIKSQVVFHQAFQTGGQDLLLLLYGSGSGGEVVPFLSLGWRPVEHWLSFRGVTLSKEIELRISTYWEADRTHSFHRDCLLTFNSS